MALPTTNNQQPTTDEVAVLIPAAGQGLRMGGKRKQFRRLGGAPVLVQTLRVFVRHPEVDDVIVAAPVDEVDVVEEMLRAAGCEERSVVVPGGATRQASVAAALKAAPEAAGVVLVHDAVRPFVAPGTVGAVVAGARTHGAAAPAVPVADTLRHAADGRFGETVVREDLYRMQTPQGFRRAWLEAAHRAAADDRRPATDDVELVQRLGHMVHLVEGRTHNLKLTTPADWKMAQALWRVWGSEFGVPDSSTPNSKLQTPNS